MRRKIIILTALFTLAVGATAAYGATAVNTYSGTNQTFSKGAGSKKKPVGISYKQILNAKNTDPSKAAAVLVNIKVKIYGLASNAKQFPTCSNTKMVALKSDSFCPKASKFASGTVNSLLGDPSLSASSRVKCNPDLDVFNAGKGKLWFFFTTHSTLQCAGLTTGSTAPYPGTVSQQGKFQVTNIPLPPDISTRGRIPAELLRFADPRDAELAQGLGQGEGQDGVQHRVGRLPEGQAAVVDHVHLDDERSRPADLHGQRFR